MAIDLDFDTDDDAPQHLRNDILSVTWVPNLSHDGAVILHLYRGAERLFNDPQAHTLAQAAIRASDSFAAMLAGDFQ